MGIKSWKCRVKVKQRSEKMDTCNNINKNRNIHMHIRTQRQTETERKIIIKKNNKKVKNQRKYKKWKIKNKK